MVLKNKRNGQAAIEFLMTYGWMLLVVLIVGALIFSFVDFGSLLPNQVDLSNNLRGDATTSIAYAQGYPTLENNVLIVFRYNGQRRGEINPDGSYLQREAEVSACQAVKLRNIDTGEEIERNGDWGPEDVMSFINGQDGVIHFECDGSLIAGDSFVGSAYIRVRDPRTQIDLPSVGSIRLQIIGN